MKTSRGQAFRKDKHGILLHVYPDAGSTMGFVSIEVKEGHFQEFYDKVSTFTYYVIEGQGTFFLNGEANEVVAGDYLSIPPNTKIYYIGKMKMVLITTPAWQEENEVHVRYIPKK